MYPISEITGAHVYKLNPYIKVNISWWRHQIETFTALLAICSPVIGEFAAQRPVTRSFAVFFDLRLNKPLSEKKREAGDLRRHRAHCGVIVMCLMLFNADFQYTNTQKTHHLGIPGKADISPLKNIFVAKLRLKILHDQYICMVWCLWCHFIYS